MPEMSTNSTQSSTRGCSLPQQDIYIGISNRPSHIKWKITSDSLKFVLNMASTKKKQTIFWISKIKKNAKINIDNLDILN